MPDIGLLQGGPPRPRVVAGRAHESVVSPADRPMAVMSAALTPVDVDEPTPTSTPTPTPTPTPTLTSTPAPEPEPTTMPTASPAAPVSSLHAAAEPPASLPLDVETPTPPERTALRDAGAPPPWRLADLGWLLLALLVIVGSGLGVRDPWPADEPRFASLARDMVATGEWLFPRVGGDLYQDKPPLFFWLLALSYSLFGAFKGWFLIPSFIAAAGILLLVYDFGRRTVGREAGLGAALLVLCTLQFVLATRGAQIDATLCLLTTFSVYALLRHLLLGHGWGWYAAGGFAAGVGIFTKGVGFLPLLLVIPFFLLRSAGWRNLAPVDAGRAGWRWWLAPLAMVAAVSLWIVPMLLAVAASGAPEYDAYRDEILLKQTVGRYAAAWHHVKPAWYFVAEVIPSLWMPWALLLFWLVPRYKAAFLAREARVWLPLAWVMLVLLFFSVSPGKRGIYIMPALPVLAMASLPVLGDVLARRGVRIAGFVLAGLFWLAALACVVGALTGARFAVDALASAGVGVLPLYLYLALAGAGLVIAALRAPLLAWPVALGALAVVFSGFLAPAMNGERSGADFVRAALAQVESEEELGLVAYKEQFLLYLDRPTVNFGHRRWQEGPQETYDAAAWLNAGERRVLLVPEDSLRPVNRFVPGSEPVDCFIENVVLAGTQSREQWFLVRGPAESACAAMGQAGRAISYPPRAR